MGTFVTSTPFAQYNRMKNTVFLFAALFCFALQSCHRPVGYFQRTPHAAARMSIERTIDRPRNGSADSLSVAGTLDSVVTDTPEPAVTPRATASLTPPTHTTAERVSHRMQRIERLLTVPVQATDKQPRPKPKQQLRLGNRIRESLGIPLRKELNWWQRISWKLKASIIVILVAVVFAIVKVTLLAIIFGLLGAFLLITGLKRSFKTKRPWF